MAKMLRRSPHFGQHVAHGAKEFFDFAGWEMPTHFSSLQQNQKPVATPQFFLTATQWASSTCRALML